MASLWAVSGAVERVAEYAVNGLAVAGGFLAGYLLGGLVAVALDRWFFNKKTPRLVRTGTKLALGVIVAILVAMLVFGKGSGGGRFGGSGTTGVGTGTPDTPQGQPTTPKEQKPPEKTPPPGKATDTTPTEVVIRITVLGGTQVTGGPDFRSQRYYLLDDDQTAKTLSETEKLLGERRKPGETRKMKVQLVAPKSGALPLDHEAYTELNRWARANGFEVALP